MSPTPVPRPGRDLADDLYAGNLPYALRGYQAASFTSALTMVVGLVAFAAWNGVPVVLQGTALGLATGCLVWSGFGTAQVVEFTSAYRRATRPSRVGGGS